MDKNYSQLRAMLAITRASLRSIFRSPSAILFSFLFPFVFILVFGVIGGSGKLNLKIAFDPHSDDQNEVYAAIRQNPGLVEVKGSAAELEEELTKGHLTAILSIQQATQAPFHYLVTIKTSDAVAAQNIQVLKSLLAGIVQSINDQQFPRQETYALINKDIQAIPGRTYRTIDFILPGQLGFSLLSAGVFGVAFIFFNLRQTLVLKRFFATPIRRPFILFGEGLSRIIFQMITAVVIVGVGHYAFHFTLIHGWLTFLELMVLSFTGLLVFMGFGFVVSGLAKNESSIPPLANIITLPQFLLTGTFFSIDNFPGWLQPFCKILPLTHLNDAMRNVAFEGAHLSQCGQQLGILGLWAIVAYAIAIRVFRWE
jgi:ABC-2 type transport system permease protein